MTEDFLFVLLLSTQGKWKANIKERDGKGLNKMKEKQELEIELNQDEWGKWFSSKNGNGLQIEELSNGTEGSQQRYLKYNKH